MNAIALALLAHLAWQASLVFASALADPYTMNRAALARRVRLFGLLAVGLALGSGAAVVAAWL